MATATAIRYDQQAHSLALAEARGETVCSWRAHSIGLTIGEDGQLENAAWRIESASSSRQYVVTYTAATDQPACECLAAQHHRGCWHAGLGLMKGRYLATLYSPVGRAAAEVVAERDAVAEDNACVLGYQ